MTEKELIIKENIDSWASLKLRTANYQKTRKRYLQYIYLTKLINVYFFKKIHNQ